MIVCVHRARVHKSQCAFANSSKSSFSSAYLLRAIKHCFEPDVILFFSLLCHTLLLSVFSPAVLECFPSYNSQLCEITLSQINLLQWLSREETEHLQHHALIVTVELILH